MLARAMPTRAEPHHVHARSRTALLLVDVLQRFPGGVGGELHREMRAALPEIAALRRRARSLRIPIIYVNDQEGRWLSSREALIARAARGARGDVARALRPAARDLLVLKPGRSGFHQSPLEAILEAFGVRRVVIAGTATDVCVLATAQDAVLRKLRVAVPSDTTVTVDAARRAAALELMANTMAVDTRPFRQVLRPPR
jgi:nicotinamidase-related amidase